MRRVFRRTIRKTLAQNVPPVLQEANFAFAKGEYGRAGELFERIAQAADVRGGPRAPLFHLQAGRARALAGQVELAMPSLRRGLEILAERRQLNRLHQAGHRLISDLRENNLEAEAQEIETWIRELAPSLPSFDEPREAQPDRPELPAHCPSCGAAISPGEVEWMDENTAECAFCGSPLRG
jgi:hypothetical protein